MKVGFQFTLDDMVEVTERSTARSRLIRGWRWRGLVVTVALIAAIVYLLSGGPAAQRIAMTVAMAVIAGLIYMPMLSTTRRHRLRKYFREQLGGDGPFSCEVELTPAGLTVAQAGARTTREWSGVASVGETPEGIEFVGRSGRALLVRNRAFASPEGRAEFLRLARGYMTPGGPA